jgi:hypothetical protein
MELFQCEKEEGKKGLENNKGEKSLGNVTKGTNEYIGCRPRPALAWQPSTVYITKGIAER